MAFSRTIRTPLLCVPAVDSGILPSAVDSLHPCSSPFGCLRHAQASKSSVLTICRANADGVVQNRSKLGILPRKEPGLHHPWLRRSLGAMHALRLPTHPGDFVAALRRPVWQRGFRMTPIFNGFQPSKMTVHPCTARTLLKTVDSQLPARKGIAPRRRPERLVARNAPCGLRPGFPPTLPRPTRQSHSVQRGPLPPQKNYSLLPSLPAPAP